MLGWVMDLADVLQNPPNLDSLSALSALGLFFHGLPVFRDDLVAYVATEKWADPRLGSAASGLSVSNYLAQN
jgi:hypothetical protein